MKHGSSYCYRDESIYPKTGISQISCGTMGSMDLVPIIFANDEWLPNEYAFRMFYLLMYLKAAHLDQYTSTCQI